MLYKQVSNASMGIFFWKIDGDFAAKFVKPSHGFFLIFCSKFFETFRIMKATIETLFTYCFNFLDNLTDYCAALPTNWWPSLAWICNYDCSYFFEFQKLKKKQMYTCAAAFENDNCRIPIITITTNLPKTLFIIRNVILCDNGHAPHTYTATPEEISNCLLIILHEINCLPVFTCYNRN